MNNKKIRVTQAFNAKLVASRRLEKFYAGELLLLLECPESPDRSRFARINGLRPFAGVECQYLIDSVELHEKTEAVGPNR